MVKSMEDDSDLSIFGNTEASKNDSPADYEEIHSGETIERRNHIQSCNN